MKWIDFEIKRPLATMISLPIFKFWFADVYSGGTKRDT